jgi:hypothetical protein
MSDTIIGRDYMVTIVCERMTVSLTIGSLWWGEETNSDDETLLREALEEIEYQYGVNLGPFVEDWYWETR